MFTNKSILGSNKDLSDGRNLEYYLEKTKNFKSSFPDFVVNEVMGFNVIDESLSCEVGYKARAGEFLVQNLKEQGFKEIVYVQPRRGFAGISLAWLAKKYDMKLTLIMPSSKEISDHQALCIELGANPLFIRIAAMPNANRMAKIYAEQTTGAAYVPLGLHHEDVIAGGVRAVHDFFEFREHPEIMWTVISTGVLTRTLQIALPNTKFKAVAVARNIQEGELGRAEFMSYHKPFDSKSDLVPVEFNCESSYDSKGWDYMVWNGNPGDWFFSVAGNAALPTIDKNVVNSQRDWNDYSDFEQAGIIF